MLRFTLENGSTLEFPVSFGPLHITMRSGIDFAHTSKIPGNFGIEISNVLPDALDYSDYDPAEDADNFRNVDERRETTPNYKLYIRPDSDYWRKIPGTNTFYPPVV